MMHELLREQAEVLSRPPMTLSDLLDELARDAPTFVRIIREAQSA